MTKKNNTKRKAPKKELKYDIILKNFFLGLTILGFVSALIYTFSNLTYPKNINIVLVLPFIFFLIPYLAMGLFAVKRIEAKVEVIPRFLRDVVDNVESGTDLISSIKNTTKNEYGVLNDDIKKFANQLGWGIDFEVALINFAENIGSKSLIRDFRLVIEARKVGGHVEKILRELSLKISTENLRNKERKSNLASNTFTGYISFLIFIFIIVLVYNNLFVGLAGSFDATGQEGQEVVEETNEMISIYLTLFILLAYELAILSGFLFGLMQENNIIAGAPHVVLLVIFTFLAFFFFV